MTVIAWDGLTLAADKQTTNNDCRKTLTKIFKHNGELFGITGAITHGLQVFEWYKAGAEIDKFPKMKEENQSAYLIRVSKDGIVSIFENEPTAITFEDGYNAFGSGRDYALGAMYSGATARGAVEATIFHCTSCGMGVDTLTLDKT